MTGYGYAVVWGRSDETLLPHIPITANGSSTSAHNSIVNVATELGLPAAIVVCAYLLAALRDAARLFAQRPSAFSAFALGFLVAVVLVGFTESLLLRVHAFWILFVAITVAVKRSLEATDDRPSEGSGQDEPLGPLEGGAPSAPGALRIASMAPTPRRPTRSRVSSRQGRSWHRHDDPDDAQRHPRLDRQSHAAVNHLSSSTSTATASDRLCDTWSSPLRCGPSALTLSSRQGEAWLRCSYSMPSYWPRACG